MRWADAGRALMLVSWCLSGAAGALDGPLIVSEDGEDDGEERLSVYDEVEVRERVDDWVGIAESSSEGSTGAEDLAQRPLLRPGEVVETVPGLIATQHSGDGKANQYFARGFNLDHGTDFSISVDGMPVNMPSHGHGQGYADLGFLIPETVQRVRYRKGTASAFAGDFSAAGSAAVRLVDRYDEGFLDLRLGNHSYGRLTFGESFEAGGGVLTTAFEANRNDGSWERGNDTERFNGLLRWVVGDATRGGSVTVMGYDGSWLSTDQIPERAVESGRVGRFGLIDPGPRGATTRTSISGDLHRGDERSLTRLTAFGQTYDFELISNFTYFLEDPERGDQFEQRDDRWTAGFDLSHSRFATLGSRPLEWTVGVSSRYDQIDNGLYRTEELRRFATVREDEIDQLGVGGYGQATVRWTSHVRSTLGLRVDYYDADVISDLAANSGSADDVLVSPKLALAFGPWNDVELYASWGRGFHSNDARGATIRVDPVSGEPVDRVSPLVRAEGIELGLRVASLPGLQSTVTVHRLELDSELVFVGDGGATEASRPSRRTGIEWTNAWQIRPWLRADLDVAWVEAEFTDHDPAGDHIPGALETVVTGGVVVEREAWSGAIRLRSFEGFPLIEDDSVRAGSTVIVNGRLELRLSSDWRLFLEGFNLLDRDDSDIEYYYASRLPGEPADGVEDVHFHPVERPSVRVGAGWRF